MKRLTSLVGIVLILATSITGVAAATTSRTSTAISQDPLFKTISTLDANLFYAFNHCSAPAELQKHASYFAPNVEFYHDKGGVTWSRQDYIAKVKENVCGKFRRYLMSGSLQVYPIKNYGAVEQGKHKFCYIKTHRCFGEGQFFILWHHLNDGKWEITRAFSYDHRPIK